jgi:hypothetical protein
MASLLDGCSETRERPARASALALRGTDDVSPHDDTLRLDGPGAKSALTYPQLLFDAADKAGARRDVGATAERILAGFSAWGEGGSGR